ncbi:hypothetical protein SAMN05444008_105169 [Cnuella takakiae]|uniref:Uncharacterized protein n=2 Tax=Cnuella takakiae TaxID=1302690 RepID=A0A1M4ZCD4_9BACT|nr:hypothetical protein SAMN05444008_105169 [Cnuella takakiae]
MLLFTTDQLITRLFFQSAENLQKELSASGWKKNPFRAHEYFKTITEHEGELQGMNIEGEIERNTLVASPRRTKFKLLPLHAVFLGKGG